MKAKLLFLLAALSALSAAAFAGGCFATGNDGGEEHEHYFGEINYDDTHHWFECECGEKEYFEEHSLYTQDTDEGLRSYCNGCGYEKITKYSPEECGKHKYVFSRTTVAPTCTTAGETEYVCTRCGNIIKQYEDALLHDYKPQWTWNGTDGASVTLTCQNDGCTDVAEDLPATIRHTHISEDCFKDGADHYDASVYFYGMSFTDRKTVVIPQHGHHTYGDEYTYDRENHWYAPTCSHGDEIKDSAAHSFVGGVCTVCKYEEGSSPNLTFTLNDDGVSYNVGNDRTNNRDKFVVIPSTHNGLPVTAITSKGFSNLNILRITIPASVTEIPSDALYRCTRLVEVYNLSSAEVASSYNLLKVHTSLEEESIIRLDGDFVFAADERYNREYLLDYWGEEARVVLPPNADGEYWIHDYCFYDCGGIEHIELPDGVKVIGNYAFNRCHVKTLVVPDSVTNIFQNVAYNSWLKEVYYKGTAQQWSGIVNSTDFSDVELYFYSQTPPAEEGNFWCFESDGHTIKIW